MLAFETKLEHARLIFELVRDIVLLLLAVAFAVVAIVCASHGSPWPLSAGSGGSSGLAGAASALSRRSGS